MLPVDALASSGTYDATFSSPSTVTNGKVPGGRVYTVYTWNDSNGNELQEYWKVNGLGHAWSGGSRGIAYILRGTSSGLRRLQTGYMRNYALAIFLGVLLIILFYVFQAVRG